MTDAVPLAAGLEAILTPELGPHTARRAIDVVAQRLERAPETWSREDVEAICECAGRMIRTLLGRARTEELLEEFRGRARS